MIGKLKGVVDEVDEDSVIVDVHGVGYVAYCSSRTLAGLPGAGEAVALFIETYVREDMIRLYGFQSALEREWFRLLMNNVQGVGAKVALAVLSTLSPPDLANAIALRDIAIVSRAPGCRQEGGRADRHRAEEQGSGLRRLGNAARSG